MKIAKSIILPILPDKIEDLDEAKSIMQQIIDALRDHNLVNYDDETDLHGAEPRFFSDEEKRKLSESWEHNWESLPSTKGFKPDDNADVTREHTALDTINLPAMPSGQPGLFADDVHLGYHDGSIWKAYIDNTGKFYFKGDADNFIQWTGTKLEMKGDMLAGIIDGVEIRVGGSGSSQEIYFKDSTIWMYDYLEGETKKQIGWKYGDLHFATLYHDSSSHHSWFGFKMTGNHYLWYTLQGNLGALKTSRNELWIGAGDEGIGDASWMRIYKTGQFSLEGQATAPTVNNFYAELAFDNEGASGKLHIYTTAWRYITSTLGW